jgi:hypothetical protein
MDNNFVIEKIKMVGNKYSDPYILGYLLEINNYVILNDFDYYEIMKVIESGKSSKLGGIGAYLNTAIEYLKNELKNEYKREKKLKSLELINYEGPILKAYKISDDEYIIVDDHRVEVAHLDGLDMYEFTIGKSTITTSYGKMYRFTDEHPDARPKAEKLNEFLNIIR